MINENTDIKALKITVWCSLAADVILSVIGLITGNHLYYLECSVYCLAGIPLAIYHGIPMYGKKNMIIFMIWGAVCSAIFECGGCNFGWFFSKYTYEAIVPGPKVFGFPLWAIIAYGVATYIIWALTKAVLGKYDNNYTKGDVIIMPIVGALLFVSIDLMTDPLMATMQSAYIWEEHGVYFGIPFQNYLGWYLLAYVEYQVCALILYFQRDKLKTPAIAKKKAFWYCPVLIYGMQFLQLLFYQFMGNNHEVTTFSGQTFWTQDIYQGVLVVAIGAILLPSLVAIIRIKNSKELE